MAKPMRSRDRSNLEKALGNPVRAEVLARLSEAPNSCPDLAREIGESRQKVQYHIDKLLELGCIEHIDEVLVRGKEKKIYRATEKMLIGPEVWKELPESSRKGVSLNIVSEGTERLQAALNAGTFDERDDRIAGNWKMRLDEEGWKEAWTLTAALIYRLEELEDEAIERNPDPMKRTPYTYSIFGYKSPPKRGLGR
jgi:DNA-binding transcriptional ArsR family regulator